MNDDLMKDFLREGFPNPERNGCPDENTLKALAEGRLPADHSARVHLGSCSECYTEYLHYRQDWAEAQERTRVTTSSAGAGRVVLPHTTGQNTAGTRNSTIRVALAASLALACAGGLIAYRHERASTSSVAQVASGQTIDASLDLFHSGTLRGVGDEAMPLHQVSLPAAVVHLSVVLPRFTDVGKYTIVVSKDKAGDQVIGKAEGDARDQAGKVTVEVTLDLRSAKPGSYFLATIRGADNGTYYYPLKIN